jgi:sugar phosphate permease
MSGLTYAILTWVPTYLVEVKKYGLMQMGLVASAPWIGAVLGAVTGGLVSDRFFDQRRKPVMMITAGSTIFTMYALILAPNDPYALSALLMVTGYLLNIGYSTFTVYPMGLVKKEGVPFAVSIVTTLGAFGAGTAPIAVGFILDHSSWSTAFAFLSGCGVVAFSLVTCIIEPRRIHHA